MRFARVLGICFVAMGCLAAAQEKPAAKPAAKKAGPSDAAYTALALSAAPKSIAKGAGVMRMAEDGGMKPLRESKNGFTCMVALGSPMCADENSMAFFGAWMKRRSFPTSSASPTCSAATRARATLIPQPERRLLTITTMVTGPIS